MNEVRRRRGTAERALHDWQILPALRPVMEFLKEVTVEKTHN